MGKVQRHRSIKCCDSCGKGEAVLYRIKVQVQEPWIFACGACQAIAKVQASYQYGGTWKQKKRN
ncbi:MAG: hypothetical protein ACI80S_000300 [Pseudohongiellaceae bacterium]|jgi:hypothetical protein